MEVLCRHPFILLDGGHNPQGIRSFRSSIDALFTDKFREYPPRLILGFMEDKDYEQILSILFADLPFDFREIICVTVDNPRSLQSKKLKTFIESHFSPGALFYKNQTTMYNRQSSIFANDSAENACMKAVADSTADGAPILCLGSLYLAGQVRGILKNDNSG
jgi:dihydrofolate synthase/folylpolyglutamate synthase